MVRSILNKITPEKFDKLSDQIVVRGARARFLPVLHMGLEFSMLAT